MLERDKYLLKESKQKMRIVTATGMGAFTFKESGHGGLIEVTFTKCHGQTLFKPFTHINLFKCHKNHLR